MKVFISWSGERSHKLALIVRDWLPSVIQAVQPYVSSEDLRKGRRWAGDIAKELEQTSFGILCIVPDNANAPWLNFEAGALSKIVEDARVVPLLFGLRPSDLVGHPQFQSAVFQKAEVLKMLQSVNELLGSARLGETRLEKAFEHWWPNLLNEVNSAADTGEPSAAPASAKPSSAASEPDLDDTEQKVLAVWAKRSPDFRLHVTHVAEFLNISEQRAQFYLDELSNKKYLHALYGMNRPTQCQIDHRGRQYLVRNGLS